MTEMSRRRAHPKSLPLSDCGDGDDPELDLMVFGNRIKAKRSELVEKYNLGGLPDDHIITIAQKEIAADQRLAEAKEAADQRLLNAQAPSAPAQGDGAPVDQRGEPDAPDADSERGSKDPPGRSRPAFVRRRSPSPAAGIRASERSTPLKAGPLVFPKMPWWTTKA
jgi:hypothetical protein